MEKKTGFNFKRIVINAVVLFAFLIGLSYAAVVITNNDIQKNGVSAMFQGGTWTASQNLNGQNATNGSYYSPNGAEILAGSDYVICKTNDVGCSVVCTESNCSGSISLTGKHNPVFREGDFYINDINVPSNITISGLGKGITNLHIVNTGKRKAFWIQNQSNIIIKDLTIIGNNISTTSSNYYTTNDAEVGIYVLGADNLLVQNIDIKNAYYEGFWCPVFGDVGVTGSKECNNVILEGMNISGSSGSISFGIYAIRNNITSSNWIIRDNEFHAEDAAVNVNWVRNAIIERNKIYGKLRDIDVNGGFWGNIIIRDNELLGAKDGLIVQLASADQNITPDLLEISGNSVLNHASFGIGVSSQINWSSPIKITDNTIHNLTGTTVSDSGISLATSFNSSFSNVDISDNDISNVYAEGIVINDGAQVGVPVLINSKISDNLLKNTNYGNVQQGKSIELYGVYNTTFMTNIVDNTILEFRTISKNIYLKNIARILLLSNGNSYADNVLYSVLPTCNSLIYYNSVSLNRSQVYSSCLCTEADTWKCTINDATLTQISDESRVFYAPFSNNAKDYSPYAYDGTVTNAVYTSSGKVGGGYTFDGAGDYIDFGLNPNTNLVNVNWTMLGWLYPLENEYETVLGNDANNASGGWQLGTYTSSNMMYYLGVTSISSSANTLPQNTWTHFAFVYHNDSLTGDWYFNGRYNSTSVSLPSLFVSSHTLVAGVDPRDKSGQEYNGTSDELMIFNRSLSDSEIYGYANLKSEFYGRQR